MKFSNIFLNDLSIIAKKILNSYDFPLIIFLSGPLGSGKTTLAKAIAKELNIDPNIITSPTFTICNEYQISEKKITHIDLYRLKEKNKNTDFLMLFEIIESSDLTIIEWGNQIMKKKFNSNLEIRIDEKNKNYRNFEFIENNIIQKN